MEILISIITNVNIWIPIVVLCLTQGAKVIYFAIKDKHIDIYKILTNGGLPSSHSAFVTSLALMLGITNGFDSGLFALACGLALIVMHDASSIRNAAGKHAKILNKIMENDESLSDDQKNEKLVELLGHTKLEVFAGFITGIVLTLLILLFIH